MTDDAAESRRPATPEDAGQARPEDAGPALPPPPDPAPSAPTPRASDEPDDRPGPLPPVRDPGPSAAGGQPPDPGTPPGAGGPPPGPGTPPWGYGPTAAPPPPAGAGFTSRYGLVRPRQGRYLAGVCAAIGRATNTDPVLWRVLLAVLGFFGGIGILIYIAAWLIIPNEGDTASPVESMLGRGRSSMSPVTVLVLGILVAVMFGLIVTDGFRAVLLGAAILIGGALLLNRNGPGRSAAPPPPPGPTPAQPGPAWPGADWPSAAAATGERYPTGAAAGTGATWPVDQPAAPGYPSGGGYPYPTPAAGGPPGAVPGYPPYTAAGPTGAAGHPGATSGPPAPVWPSAPVSSGPPPSAASTTEFPAVTTPFPAPTPAGPPPPDRGYRPAFAPRGPYAGTGVNPVGPYPPQVKPPKPPKPPKERSPLGAATFSLIFVAIGAVTILDLTNAIPVTTSGYFAAALVTVALGLLVGAWFGRARWLIALGLAAAAALGISTLTESYNVNSHDGTVNWTPGGYDQLADRYENSFGDATLDLRQVNFTGHDAQVEVQVRFGTLKVILPPSVDVTASGDVTAGDAQIFSTHWSGVDGRNREVTDLGTDGAGGGKLRLDVHVDAGNVEVSR